MMAVPNGSTGLCNGTNAELTCIESTRSTRLMMPVAKMIPVSPDSTVMDIPSRRI